jgi:hypothetical protein
LADLYKKVDQEEQLTMIQMMRETDENLATI